MFLCINHSILKQDCKRKMLGIIILCFQVGGYQNCVSCTNVCLQVAFGNPISSNCCPSKTVGDFSYSLVETEASVPAECFNCTYARDDVPGSLFCFAPGDLPVHCDKEKPVGIAHPGIPNQSWIFDEIIFCFQINSCPCTSLI